MGIWHTPRETLTGSSAEHWRPYVVFLRHLGEMVLVMMLGMAVLGIPYRAVMAEIGYSDPIERFPELSALVMTFNMILPMVGWMRYRGHRWERAWEMAAAMMVPAIALVVLCFLGMIPRSNLSGAVMIPMIPAMVIVMLYRRAEYLRDSRYRQIAAGVR
jgi:flagellar biosynthetic protein FliP